MNQNPNTFRIHPDPGWGKGSTPLSSSALRNTPRLQLIQKTSCLDHTTLPSTPRTPNAEGFACSMVHSVPTFSDKLVEATILVLPITATWCVYLYGEFPWLPPMLALEALHFVFGGKVLSWLLSGWMFSLLLLGNMCFLTNQKVKLSVPGAIATQARKKKTRDRTR